MMVDVEGTNIEYFAPTLTIDPTSTTILMIRISPIFTGLCIMMINRIYK